MLVNDTTATWPITCIKKKKSFVLQLICQINININICQIHINICQIHIKYEYCIYTAAGLKSYLLLILPCDWMA